MANFLKTKLTGLNNANPMFWLFQKVMEIVDKRKSENVVIKIF